MTSVRRILDADDPATVQHPGLAYGVQDDLAYMAPASEFLLCVRGLVQRERRGDDGLDLGITSHVH
jgi:hypothetical protein